MRTKMFALCLLAVLPTLALAADLPDRRFREKSRDFVSLATGEQIFENPPQLCITNDTCDLKKVIFRKEDYLLPQEFPTDQQLQSTSMFAGFLVDDVAQLTKYSFVQFTRGCMWFATLRGDGGLDTEFGVIRDFIGMPKMQHVFPRWVVDDIDGDPAYGSYSALGNRHYFLQLADTVPAWIPRKQGKLYGEVPPTFPFGYITDAPGPAIYSPLMLSATNMSLEFRTCLFKTADVPTRTDGTNVDIDKALVCFRWESKFEFDHKKLTFKSPRGIHDECKRPFNAREKNFHLDRLDKIENDEEMPIK